MRKVSSMTLDTNVISDIPALAYYEQVLKTKSIPKDEQDYFHRCRSSKKAIFIMLDFAIERVGLRIVYKELLVKPPLHMLYKKIFPYDAKVDKRCKRLADAYVRKLSINAADALVVAMSTTNRLDVLLSWNRKDIVNRKNLEAIERINKSAGLKTSEILTPRDFLDRVIKTDRKSVALSPSPLPPIYRVDSYLSKHGI